MIVTPETLLLLFVIAVFAGAISAVAGGASFLTFPALMFAGLPPLIANATNFVALVPGNIAALPAYRKELRDLGRDLIAPVIIGAAGGFSGAVLLVYFSSDLFADLVPYLMGTATMLFVVAPYMRRFLANATTRTSKIGLVCLFFFSVYGGYFGAGLGQITMAALIFLGFEGFHRVNAAKNLVISAISLLSVFVYGFSGTVSWPHALVMMAGTSIGGYFGGYVARFIPEIVLRWGVIMFGASLTAYYFWAEL
jgi:uncharacterized membrane protein YfcA